jgi:hypothetical protein
MFYAWWPPHFLSHCNGTVLMHGTAVYFYAWMHLYQKLKMHCYILHRLQSKNITTTNSQVYWDVFMPPFIQAEFLLINLNTLQGFQVNTSFYRYVNHLALCPTEWNNLPIAEQSLRFYGSDFKTLPYQALCDTKRYMWDMVEITASLFAWKWWESQ